MKSSCWDTHATDSIIKSGQKDTEASILELFNILTTNLQIGVSKMLEIHFQPISGYQGSKFSGGVCLDPPTKGA